MSQRTHCVQKQDIFEHFHPKKNPKNNYHIVKNYITEDEIIEFRIAEKIVQNYTKLYRNYKKI